MSSARIVGQVVADLVKAELLRSVEDPGEQAAVVVRSFEEDEVIALASALDGFILPGESAPVDIRVGTTRDVRGLEGRRLAAGETLTRYRNNNVSGLVLIELDPFSDVNGIANIVAFDDQTVLDRDLTPEVTGQRLRSIVSTTWALQVESDSGIGAPEQLIKRITEVHGILSRTSEISLRRWIRFSNVSAAALASQMVSGHSAVDRAVGESLTALGLFPDPETFAVAGAIKRQIQTNQNVAQRLHPTGREITEEDLVARIEQVAFDSDRLRDARLPDAVTARGWMREVAEGGGEDARSRIHLKVWLELFRTNPTKAALGSRIRTALSEQFPERVQEFDDLAIESGLDEGEQEAAQVLLRSEPEDEQVAVIDLLPKQIKRRVEKLAIPRVTAETDPLRALLYGLQGLERAADEEPRTVEVRRESFKDPEGRLSAALFAFLYGPSLSEICLSSADGMGARLVVDESLLTVQSIAALFPPEKEDAPIDLAELWGPLRLSIRVQGQLDPLHRFEWRPMDAPGIVRLAQIIQTQSELCGDRLNETLDDWCQRALDPAAWRDRAEPARVERAMGDGFADKWLTARRELFIKLSVTGLDSAILDEFGAWWADHVSDARQSLVPHNAPQPELEEFLDVDTVRLPRDRTAMLATHPLRLRWISTHSQQMTRRILSSLENGLVLNDENDQLFFDWLDRVSPHRQPAFASGGNQTLSIPTREYGLHEEYAPIQQAGTERRDWLAGIDEASVDEVARVVRTYLEAYPHKTDGIALLLLLQDGDPLVAVRLLKRVREREYANARVELHVVTPRRYHDRITREIEGISDSNGIGSAIFMPNVQLILHEWLEGASYPDLAHLVDKIDIAIAPNLFGTKTSAQANTRRSEMGISGRFDPWVDPTSHDVPTAGSTVRENVSRVLLPAEPDPLLEAWSTLCVRRYRNAPVSPDEGLATDYLSLQIQFHAGVPLFRSLHLSAHWVVTLDPFVGRDQVDALEGCPDVILVRSGIGKNETYTLIVSSETGSRFVTRRLARKLQHDFRLQLRNGPDIVARRLYEVGRNTLPGVILRALGLGRTAEEIVGLIASRYAVEEAFPAPTGSTGFEWWISLDEHLNWFGGSRGSRADLLRVIAVDDGDELILTLHVVESKFRSAEDLGIADQQLARTISLLAGVVGNAGRGEREADDAVFWRREILGALSQTSKSGLEASELPALRPLGAHSVTAVDFRAKLLAGDFRVDELIGIAVAIAYDQPGNGSRGYTPQNHHCLRLFRDDIARILDRLVDQIPPVERIDSAVGEASPAHRFDLIGDESVSLRLDDSNGDWDAVAGGADAIENSATLGVRVSDTRLFNDGRGGLSLDSLRSKYNNMLNVFAAHNVLVDAPGADLFEEGPGFYVLRVIPRSGVSVDRLMNRKDDLKLALMLEASQDIRAFVDRGTVVLEVPKLDSERYDVFAENIWTRTTWNSDSLYVPLGEDIQGNVVGVDFSSPDSPHLLIGGTTGSGKSVLVDTLIRGLIGHYSAEQVRFFLVDPKGTELVDFEGSPHVEGSIGMDAVDALGILEMAVEEMQRRYTILKNKRVRRISEYNSLVGKEVRLPWWIIVLDEYGDLTSDPDDKVQIERALKRLAQKARASGIHLIVATQKPSAEVISTTVRSNLPAQIALRVKTASDSRIIMDEAGAETLAGKGDAFLKTAKGLTRLQAAFCREPFIIR
ncbi:FtsK/SpoIIIE domain-containing protein [Pseudonocardia xinjiangensis]|uniref:FtsK/SpoIIIE domain-containing protein n=1 Tax=Pseudonocardia xinjiangensis TaxID=75289 RepID=UPI003D90BC63